MIWKLRDILIPMFVNWRPAGHARAHGICGCCWTRATRVRGGHGEPVASEARSSHALTLTGSTPAPAQTLQAEGPAAGP